MSTHRKTYRYRMEPTKEQGQSLDRMAGARRWVWNHFLARRKEHYRDFSNTLSYGAMAAELTSLKTRLETAWLKEADSQALQQVLKDLCQAFVNFFEGRAKFPRFKSRKRDRARFRIPQRVKVGEGKVYVPKVGLVRIRQSQDIEGTTKSATFNRHARGHWFVTIVAEFEMPDVALPEADPLKIVGIDLGLIDFVTLSDGTEPIPAPKFYRKGEKAQRRAQREFSRREKGSKRKAKAARKVAIVRQTVADQRKDFLHKLSTKLVSEYSGLCIEDLSVRGLARTKLAKSVNDASWGDFRRMLEYKSLWNRNHLIVIDRFFPSSKMCNGCGAINETLTLKDRQWSCVTCGAVHSRDLNAARNILDEGLRTVGRGTPELKAQGQPVRPVKVGKVG